MAVTKDQKPRPKQAQPKLKPRPAPSLTQAPAAWVKDKYSRAFSGRRGASAPAAPAAPAVPKAPFNTGRLLGNLGGAAAGVTEVANLADISSTQGVDAAMVEAPRAGGRVAGAMAGARVGAKIPGGGVSKLATSIAGGAAGYALGDDAVDAYVDRYNASPIGKSMAMWPPAMSLSPSVAPQNTYGNVRGAINAVSDAYNKEGDWADKAAAGLGGFARGRAAAGRPIEVLGADVRAPAKAAPAPAAAAPTFDDVTGVVDSTEQAVGESQRAYGRRTGNYGDMQGDAPVAPAGPDQVVPVADDSQNIQMRGRQGSIIANPDAMSTLNRLRALSSDPSLKGSPSLRRAAAEQIMSEDQRKEARFQSAQTEDNANSRLETELQANARRAFADRSSVVDRFNVDTSETRRKFSVENGLNEDNTLVEAGKLGLDQQRAADDRQQRSIERDDKAVAAAMARDPNLSLEQAITQTGAVRTLEGKDPDGSDIGVAAQTLAANAMDAGIASRQNRNPLRRGVNAIGRAVMNNSLFGDTYAAPDDFERGAVSPDAYSNFKGLGFADRLKARLVPGVTADDVSAVDRSGKRIALPRSSLSGLTPEQANRQRYLRMKAGRD